ncbi:uncharacterized protein BDR25DRAFT_362695 [Lindgomyces ingoldianus]|uniref:Uncharacterized protein n=1 Tax=Lindgomyces ingoldianus TaxID=673940 RepID=A0ACB6QAW6_9PLEO|nr:uncharacterized protein BDR25DRAFT_362695 [Lindgomyces ingoldianus]KAF2463527.1 hypothetical protein BDR25DRAFT_362695 [Lindgomyces ingoldianus]
MPLRSEDCWFAGEVSGFYSQCRGFRVEGKDFDLFDRLQFLVGVIKSKVQDRRRWGEEGLPRPQLPENPDLRKVEMYGYENLAGRPERPTGKRVSRATTSTIIPHAVHVSLSNWYRRGWNSLTLSGCYPIRKPRNQYTLLGEPDICNGTQGGKYCEGDWWWLRSTAGSSEDRAQARQHLG